MAEGVLVIGSRRYSSWSLRGWLAVRLAGLDVEEVVLRLDGTGASPGVRDASPSGLVPFLEHRGAKIWESLAICEYCAEIQPALWPAERIARASARAIAAEMHAGFRALRMAMPMVLHTQRSIVPTPEVAADIARICTIWREARAQFAASGDFLFGDVFGAADAMFVPVVARMLIYRPELPPEAVAYCAAVRAHPLVAAWYDAAAGEPQSWRIARYETPAGG